MRDFRRFADRYFELLAPLFDTATAEERAEAEALLFASSADEVEDADRERLHERLDVLQHTLSARVDILLARDAGETERAKVLLRAFRRWDTQTKLVRRILDDDGFKNARLSVRDDTAHVVADVPDIRVPLLKRRWRSLFRKAAPRIPIRIRISRPSRRLTDDEADALLALPPPARRKPN